MTSGSTPLARIPGSIWAIGFVSMFMDISSEMIHALLPVYLVTVLGTSTLTVGIIEGIAEATANITKIFSGALSDWMGKRKLLAVIGYGLAAITKPVFPLAPTVSWLVAARFVDRIGKGIRGAPRDALVADLAPPNLKGASFGLRQSLDTVGAFLGPLVAIGLMMLSGNDFRLVFWIAVIPAFMAVALLLFAVQEPEKSVATRPPRFSVRAATRLPAGYWVVVGIATALTLARFSEAFLLLRAQANGFSLALVPLVLVLMNIVYALSSYPAGVLADRFGRTGGLVAGLICLIGADLLLAFATDTWITMGGVVLWGLHMGLTQGVLATLVADTAPSDLRGSAFGAFNFASGIAMLVASVMAGLLWDTYGPAATFMAGAAFAIIALCGLLAARSTLISNQIERQ